MKEYKIIIKVQNNYMFTAMKSMGIDTAAELSRLSDVSQSAIGGYLNLKKSPFNKAGEYYLDIVRISNVLNTMVTDLFPEDQLYNPLDKNTATFEMEKTQVEQLMHYSEPDELLENISFSESVGYVLNGLTEREQKVIRARFGFDGEEKTLKEVGDEFGVSMSRIRQIEEKALRKMRHPKRAAVLKMQNKSKESLDEYLESR